MYKPRTAVEIISQIAMCCMIFASIAACTYNPLVDRPSRYVGGAVQYPKGWPLPGYKLPDGAERARLITLVDEHEDNGCTRVIRDYSDDRSQLLRTHYLLAFWHREEMSSIRLHFFDEATKHGFPHLYLQASKWHFNEYSEDGRFALSVVWSSGYQTYIVELVDSETYEYKETLSTMLNSNEVCQNMALQDSETARLECIFVFQPFNKAE